MSFRKKKPGVTFQIYFQDRWTPIDRFLEDPEPIWTAWLSDDEDNYDGESEGFFVTADGAAWNGSETVDTCLTAFSWIEALSELLVGQSPKEPVQVWAWEESNMRIWRKGSLLYMEDKPYLPRVCFDIQAFLEVFLPEAEKYYALLDRFRLYAEALRPSAEAMREALRAEAEQIPAIPSGVLYDQKVRAERPGSDAAEKEKYQAMREQHRKREQLMYRSEAALRLLDEEILDRTFPVDSLRALQNYHRGETAKGGEA